MVAEAEDFFSNLPAATLVEEVSKLASSNYANVASSTYSQMHTWLTFDLWISTPPLHCSKRRPRHQR